MSADDPSTRPAILAALDLGTNNCRLLVAKAGPTNGFRIVESFSRITRLGEGLEASGQLSEAAMARTLAALAECAAILARRPARHRRLIATAACRRAANADRFLARVKDATGLELEIVSAAEEARLAMLGCVPLLDRKRRHALVFDIGGGSTEAIWLERRNGGPPRLIDYLSLPMGVVTLTEAGAAKRDGLLAEARARFGAFESRLGIGARFAKGQAQALGTSGTVTTLGAIHLGLDRYERRRVDGLRLTGLELDEACRRLKAMSPEERAANPCIGPERADLVLAGIGLLEAMRAVWTLPGLRVADRGLREGLLHGLADQARRAHAASEGSGR